MSEAMKELLGMAATDKALIGTLYDALERALPLLESIEAKALVGDEGCLWPVEIVRAALATKQGAAVAGEEQDNPSSGCTPYVMSADESAAVDRAHMKSVETVSSPNPCTAGSPDAWTPKERACIDELMALQQLSERAVVRQALAHYQIICRKAHGTYVGLGSKLPDAKLTQSEDK